MRKAELIIAFKSEFITDDEILLDMLEDRNKFSHIYDETTSSEIFERIKLAYVHSIDKVIKLLKEKIN